MKYFVNTRVLFRLRKIVFPTTSSTGRLLFLILSINLLVLGKLFSQQEPQFTKYMFNTLSFNPAYAGSKEYLSVVAIYRDQWFNWGDGIGDGSYAGRPITQTFSMHAGLQDRIGLGMNITNDRVGVRGTTGIDFSYAYRIDFGKGKLALGIQAGLLNWRADWDELSYKDPQHLDNAYAGDNPSLWLPNFGGGIYFYNENLYLGISIPRLGGIALRDSIDRDVIQRWAKHYQHLYITIGGAIPIKDESLIFKPSLLIKSVGLFSEFLAKGDNIRSVGVPTSFELSAAFFFFQKLWLGSSFRSAFAAFEEGDPALNRFKSSHSSIDAMLVYHFSTGMRLGFAYDYSLNQINSYTPGSFELMVGWDFVKKLNKTTHPRYFF